MKCTHPNHVLLLAKELDTPFMNGKYHIKFLGHRADLSSISQIESRYGKGSVIPIPCGRCLACRENYTADWSVRCMLEASLYKENYFVTLTYDDAHHPYACRKDFQEFINRLNYYAPGVRVFYCFEKGETTKRKHFHAILFNCPLPDLKFIGRRDGNPVYDSKIIQRCWQCGLIDIGDVTPASCQYVAGYVMKKLREKDPEEFIGMSLRPGIGAGYFDKHFEEIYDTDGVYLNGKKHHVPRYFDKLLDRVNPDMFRKVKYQRISDIADSVISELVVHGLTYHEGLYEYNERVYAGQMKDKLKKRSAI